ncbi:MAG: POTRA domain-containing protein, partial [Pseudomonadota bacterium]
MVRVERILVEGARRLDDATIRAYMTVTEGEPATAAQINESLRRLLDTGLFENVTIQPFADGLLVQVVEAPFINLVAFEGNDALDDDTLRGSVQSTSRSAFSRSVAERDAQTLLEIYRRSGRFGASIEPVVIERENNRVDLVFEIVEGQVTGIRSIDFVGNRAFSDRRLRGAVETRETGLLSFIFGSDTYDPDRLEFDKELLRRFYLDRGYADFEV